MRSGARPREGHARHHHRARLIAVRVGKTSEVCPVCLGYLGARS